MVSTMAKGSVLVLGVALSHLAPLVSCTLYAADADMDHDYYSDRSDYYGFADKVIPTHHDPGMTTYDDPDEVKKWVDANLVGLGSFTQGPPKKEYMGRIVSGKSVRLHAYGAKLVFCFSGDGIKKIMSDVVMNKDKKKAGQNFADILGYSEPPTVPQRFIIFETTRTQTLQIKWESLGTWLADMEHGLFLKGPKTIAETYEAVAAKFAIDGPKDSKRLMNKEMNAECEARLSKTCSGSREHEELKNKTKAGAACTDAWNQVLKRKTVDWMTGKLKVGKKSCVPTGERWELRTLMAQSGFNPLWAGTGFTESATGELGVKEYLEPDEAIANLTGIEYTIPAFA